ncbi:Alkylphosphonate utilization operon protein PhnA [hydrothermal vent metagenome]|uniref:Alkylphosphonate utilization operon protein PhnA n=1 Tax=hydrothermal vent metagenome TaxID=652676 RepID=A0A3B1EA19_9ZZZZ
MNCEFCKSTDNLSNYEIPTIDKQSTEDILCCQICNEQLKDNSKIQPNHWRCLSDSMWSQNNATAMMSYVMLSKIKESWSEDLLNTLYLDEDIKKWGDSIISQTQEMPSPKDSNGVSLKTGDSISVIKDLEVKGAGFTVKRGTIVKNIYLNGNIEQIEGRVNGTRIVLLSKFIKKI